MMLSTMTHTLSLRAPWFYASRYQTWPHCAKHWHINQKFLLADHPQHPLMRHHKKHPALVTLKMLWWASPSKFCQASYTSYSVNCHHGHDMASIIVGSTFVSNIKTNICYCSSCQFYWIAFSNLAIPACGFVQGAGISSAWRLGRLSWSGSCQWPNCGLWMTVVSTIIDR